LKYERIPKPTPWCTRSAENRKTIESRKKALKLFGRAVNAVDEMMGIRETKFRRNCYHGD